MNYAEKLRAVDSSVGALLAELRYRLKVATAHHVEAAEIALVADATRNRAWTTKDVLEQAIARLERQEVRSGEKVTGE